jgi:ABC-2 type transport system permease protein
MITRIARKEFTEMIRDGRYAWAAAIIFTLLTVSLVTGWRQHAEVKRQQTAAQESQRAFWLNQGAKNPHSAAHYGVYAFKPQLALAAVDKGLDPYLGVSQFLEAHRQNAAQFRPVEDATPLARFGELTAATTLQVLLPLLIILLGYNAFAGEREGRTLRQLLSLGVSKTQLTLGKALGVAAPLALLLIPATVLGVVAMALNAGAASLWLSLPRLAVMSACYLAYFAIFIGLALIVSARASSARTALVVLLGFWFLNSLVAARLVTDVAKAAYPTPTAVEFNKAIADEIRGHGDWEQQVEKKKTELMAQYKVTDAKFLPVHPEAVVLDEGEKVDTQVNDKHFTRLNDIYANQQRVYQWGASLAPLLAVQSLSMGMAGTDFAHHRHFAGAAEKYRQQLVNTLNQEMLAKGNIEAIWDFKADRALWEKVPAFDYTAPGTGWALSHHWLGLLLLAAWLVVVLIATPLVVRTARID